MLAKYMALPASLASGLNNLFTEYDNTVMNRMKIIHTDHSYVLTHLQRTTNTPSCTEACADLVINCQWSGVCSNFVIPQMVACHFYLTADLYAELQYLMSYIRY